MLIRPALSALLVLAACGGVSEESPDAGPEPTPDASTEVPNAERSLYYHFEGRACLSEPDDSGSRTSQEPALSCSTDADCADAAFPRCRHLEDAANAPDLSTFIPTPATPPVPEPVASPSDYHIRYVPLCSDGSGDHENAIFGDGAGVAPTCAPADYIRCADGTRPYYFANLADSASSDWLFFAGQGGFALPAADSAWSGMHVARSAFGYQGAPPSTRAGLGGVFADTSGTAFDDFHRVWLEKCSPDRFQGTATRAETADATPCVEGSGCTGTLEPPANDPEREIDVHFHGALMVEAMLADLAGATPLYNDDLEVLGTMPALADADEVVLSCHSNGCNGLQLSYDEKATQIAAIAPAATVRAVFNSFFAASLEGEHAAIEGAAEGNVIGDRSIYDHVTTGLSIALDDDGNHAPISATTYASGEIALAHERFGATLDASCLAAHPDTPSACQDTMHVLFNHLGHEFFYVLAQRDQSLSEGGGPKAPYCDGRTGHPFGCLFAGVELSWVGMIRKQLADLIEGGASERCEAASGPGPYQTNGFWAPAWNIHAGWQDAEVATKRLRLPGTASVALHEAVESWIASGVRPVFVEDVIQLDGSARNSALGLPVATSP